MEEIEEEKIEIYHKKVVRPNFKLKKDGLFMDYGFSYSQIYIPSTIQPITANSLYDNVDDWLYGYGSGSFGSYGSNL